MKRTTIKKITLFIITAFCYLFFSIMFLFLFTEKTNICLNDSSALCPEVHLAYRNRSVFILYGIPFAALTYYSLLIFFTKEQRKTKARIESIQIYKKGRIFSFISIAFLVSWFLYTQLLPNNYNSLISFIFLGLFVILTIIAQSHFNKIKIKIK